MRLYLFAIGGTGSRVLKSLVMQFAAGIRPRLDGSASESFSVVPIILDPHASNKAVVDANNCLVNYQRIRQSIYASAGATSGFYSVKIESLQDIADSGKSTAKLLPFIYQMPEINEKKFREFVGGNGANLSNETQYFTNILISEDEQDTEMSKGFYGQPNIGTIALSTFKNTDTFNAFRNSFQEGDRIMFIGSIFGGTGASGMPLLTTSLRQDTENLSIPKAPFGAIIMMPYFSLDFKGDEYSKIKQKDFELKTKSALTYYEDNLNRYLNAIYYLADKDKSSPVENDPGEKDQSGNRAHIVEFLAGLAVLDFACRVYKDDESIDKGGYREAKETVPFQFSLISRNNNQSQTIINFADFDKVTKEMIIAPMIKYHLLWLYLSNGHFKKALNGNDSYIKRGQFTAALMTPELSNFLDNYANWLCEMGGYDLTNPCGSLFKPFKWISREDTDFSDVAIEVSLKKKRIGKRTIKVKKIEDYLNNNIDEALSLSIEDSMSGRFFINANLGLTKLFNDNYELE